MNNSTFGLLKPGKLNAPSATDAPAALAVVELMVVGPAAAAAAVGALPSACSRCCAVALAGAVALLFVAAVGGAVREMPLIAIGNGCTCMPAGKNGKPNTDGWIWAEIVGPVVMLLEEVVVGVSVDVVVVLVVLLAAALGLSAEKLICACSENSIKKCSLHFAIEHHLQLYRKTSLYNS